MFKKKQRDASTIKAKKGAGEKKQARHYAWLLVVINYVLLGVICSAMFFCRGLVVGWYHLSAPSARLAEDLILAHTIAMIIWPLAFPFPYYFRASGSAAFTMIKRESRLDLVSVRMKAFFNGRG